MASKAGQSKDYTEQFILDEARLRKLVSILEDYSRRLDKETALLFHVAREGGSFYETNSVEEVLDDANTPEKDISSLMIELKESKPPAEQVRLPEDERPPLAAIAFSHKRDWRVKFAVRCENRDWCVLLADELNSEIKRVIQKPSLKFFPRRHLDLVVMACLLALMMWVLITFMGKSSPSLDLSALTQMTQDKKLDTVLRTLSENREFRGAWILPVFLLTMVLFVVALEFRPLARLMGKYQRSVFYWGDMKSVWDRQRARATTVKWVLLAGFIISLLSTIVGGYLMGQHIQMP